MARYSNKHRRAGELTAPEVGKLLGYTNKTICEWCREALSDGRSVLPKDSIRQDLAGRYWIAELGVAVARRQLEKKDNS